MATKEVSHKLSRILYGLGGMAFLLQCVLWQISPFGRMLLVAGACVFVYWGSIKRTCTAKTETQQKVMKRTFVCLFLMYLFLLITLVFFDSLFAEENRAEYGVGVNSLGQYIKESASFVPFKTSTDLLKAYSKGWISAQMPLVNICGNLLLCMPFAFFLPLFFRKQHNIFVFFLTVSLVAILIETLQLLTMRGFCDIDDFIFNVSGAMLLYGLLHIKPIRKSVDKITKLKY